MFRKQFQDAALPVIAYDIVKATFDDALRQSVRNDDFNLYVLRALGAVRMQIFPRELPGTVQTYAYLPDKETIEGEGSIKGRFWLNTSHGMFMTQHDKGIVFMLRQKAPPMTAARHHMILGIDGVPCEDADKGLTFTVRRIVIPEIDQRGDIRRQRTFPLEEKCARQAFVYAGNCLEQMTGGTRLNPRENQRRAGISLA